MKLLQVTVIAFTATFIYGGKEFINKKKIAFVECFKKFTLTPMNVNY